MRMNEAVIRVLALASGGLLGAIFFGGLLWTVNKGLSSKKPAYWFVFSWVARMSIALIGFYLISEGRPGRLISCLLGFVLASVLVAQLTRPPKRVAREGGYAP